MTIRIRPAAFRWSPAEHAATPGRDHNQYGLVVWVTGGDVKRGATFGETTDFSVLTAGDLIPLRDVHVALL